MEKHESVKSFRVIGISVFFLLNPLAFNANSRKRKLFSVLFLADELTEITH
jgi:hypothetical protein